MGSRSNFINPPALRVAVVGATGLVGRELLALLEKRRFPVARLSCFSSGTKNEILRFRGESLKAPTPAAAILRRQDLVFLASSDEVSLRLAPDLAKRGIWVIDDSAAFRLDKNIPLVIPEINSDALTPQTRLIAGPNCTMTGLAVAGAGLHREIGVRQVRAASYQAVSGAGRKALEEFLKQNQSVNRRVRSGFSRAPLAPEQSHAALPRPIAFNVIPQVGEIDEAGNTGEENKVAAELRKVWNAPNLKVSVTAVRVPVLRAHSLCAWLTLEKPTTPEQAHRILKETRGLKVCPQKEYPTPLSAQGRAGVYAGRVRQGATPNEMCMWIVSDNLLKGAALNSVEIAEELLRRGWLGPIDSPGFKF